MRVLAERYELGDQLGVGGMARVVRAHDTLLDRPVAVKLLSDAPDDQARERFLREARSSARLRHPSAVAVYDTGEDGDQPYIVMELIEGQSLADLLRDRGQLDVEEAIGITASVLDALGAAHTAGMIHRDVKPANVLLPDEGGVKLSDFGIAKAMDDASEGLTATGSVLGTPSYLAPELIEGSRASPASDLYSVGCLLYAQLAGRPPFRGAPLTVAYAHRHEPVPPIASERPDLPEEVLAVLDRALDKDPDRRFADATSMRVALLGGPLGEPTDGQATVAMAAPAAAPTGEPGGATQVLPGATPHDEAGEPTRAMHAGGEPIDASPARSRRGRGPLVALIALLVVALVVWFVLGREGADDTTDEPPEDVTEEPDEPEEPTPDEQPADEGPEEPAPEEPAPEEPAPEEPAPEEPAPEEPAPEEPAPEEPEPEEPEPEEPGDTDPGDGDEGTPPGQDATGGGPPDSTPGQGVPGGGSAGTSAPDGATPPGEQAAPARG